MRKRLPTFAAILSPLGFFLPSRPPRPPAAADPPKEASHGQQTGRRRGHQQAARRRAHDRLRGERGHVDLGRRVAGRPDRGVRPAGRHLRHADRGRPGQAALTSGPAWDDHPRYSPDGKTIAFTSDRSGIENVWIMDADGGDPRAVTAEKDEYVRSAAWTPDGNYLIARKETGKRAGIPPVELWMYNREGGGGIKLTSSDDVNNAGGAVVSRDGRSIYFSARQRRFSYTPT